MYSDSDLYSLLVFHPLFPAVACSSWNNGDRASAGMAQMSHQTSEHQSHHYFQSFRPKKEASGLKNQHTHTAERAFSHNLATNQIVAGDFSFEVLTVCKFKITFNALGRRASSSYRFVVTSHCFQPLAL